MPVARPVAPAPAVPPDVALAVAQLEVASADDSADALARVGVAWALTGRVNAGIEALEDAVRRDPSNGTWWSDLAAAYLMRAASGPRRAIDVPRALASADRAVVAGAGPAARFNRALALQALLPTTAKSAWSDYLAHDPASAWAAEATARRDAAARAPAPGAIERQHRLADLATPLGPDAVVALIDASAGTAREAAEDLLLPAWGRAVIAGDSARADLALERARVIGERVASTTGDGSVRDAVLAIDRAPSAARPVLARAHMEYGEARQAYDALRLAEAQVLFRRASPVFDSHGSPMVLWARMHDVFVDAHLGRVDQALTAIAVVFAQASARGMDGVVGRIHRMRGVLLGRAGRLTAGRAEYELGVEALERAREPGTLVSLRSTMAETLDMLGESADGWMRRLSALGSLRDVPRGTRYNLVLQGAAQASQGIDAPEAGLFLVDALIEAAVQERDALAEFEGYRRRAEIEIDLGRHDACAASVARARAAAQRLPEPVLVQRASAELDLIEGRLRASTTGDALPLLDAAADAFTRLGVPGRLPALLLYRGMALSRTEPAAARAALDGGIAALEKAGTVGFGATGFVPRTLADLFEAHLRLDLEQDDAAADVRTLERERLLQLGRSTLTPVIPTARLAGTSPDPGVRTIVYRFIGSRLHAWSFDGRTWMRHPLRATQEEIVRLVLRYRHGVDLGEDRARLEAAGKALFEALLMPLTQRIAGARVLTVLPHGALHGVPFAALVDPATGRFLVQDVAVTVSPTQTVLTSAARRPRAWSGTERALIVGASLPDPSLDVPALRATEVEARAVASTMAASSVLVGADATVRRFRDALPRHDVVHFSGHVVPSLAAPAYSRLLFAADADAKSTNVLYARDVGALPLARTRLVVLAACETARTDLLPGEGLNSLAAQFLAAGVPAVIATSWPIDDAVSARIFPMFYASLRRSPSPAQALREVQVELMTHADPVLRSPAVWGALQAFGASSGPAN